MPATTYDVVTAVWGIDFIDLFLNVCVLNQLSPGNLPALPAGSRYRILTRPEDVDRLAASLRLDAVRRLLPVDVVGVDVMDEGGTKARTIRNRYRMMTACHRRAVSDAAVRRAALIFLAPDFVLAHGTIAALVRIHSSGKRAVLSANLRLARESFVPAFAECSADRAPAPRDLVRLAVGHLHPSTQWAMADSANSNSFPETVLWPVCANPAGVEGYLVRAFSLHPLLLDPIRREELPRYTIDGHYLMRTGVRLKQCHVVEDSDELVVFELTPAGRAIGGHEDGHGISLLRLAAVASRCDRYQRSHWRHAIRLHAADLGPQWNAAEAASAEFVRQVERYRPYGTALFQSYRLLHIWRQRRDAWFRAVRRTLRPRVTVKQVLRPAKVQMHRIARASRLRMKQVRRSFRGFRIA